MERRALLAVLLSVVVVVLWYSLFPPKPPEPQEVGPAGAETSAPVEAGLPAEAPQGVTGEAIGGEQEEQVVLEGEGFRAVVSNRGGVIASWQLERFRDGGGKPQELVGEGVLPLTIVPDGPWNRELYQVERDGQGVVLRWGDGQGRLVEKRVWVEGAYRLRVEGRLLGLGKEAGVVVGSLATWSGVGKDDSLGRAEFVVAVGGKLKRVALGKAETVEVSLNAQFVGAEDRYFLLAFVPDRSVGARAEGAAGRAEVLVAGEFAGTLVGAPKEHKLLKGFGRGLEETLSFGLFGFLSLIFLEVLRWIHGWSGNWGVGIILLTAVIRLLLFPLTHKSTVAMRGMAKLQPKIKAIQERYQERAKKDPAARQRMNQEIMELYRRERVNPMGGCLPLVVQIPILWALYTLFAFAIELRHQPFVLWIRDLSAKDPTYITPILMTASMVLQQKLAPQTGDPAQRRMFMLLPFVFGLMFMNFPSGLVLYWLVNNVLTIGQQLLTERLLRRANGGA